MERYLFGSYPIEEARENISWLVLENQGNRAKLISEFVLDVHTFDGSGSDKSRWSTCRLREWLNGEFMDEAFTEDQRQAICETDNPCNRKGEDDICSDKVTLLSAEEVRRYFPEEKARIARATLTALENGLELPEPDDARCPWLLRSAEALEPAADAWCAETAYVTESGAIEIGHMSWQWSGIRPVITVDLEKAKRCQLDVNRKGYDPAEDLAPFHKLCDLMNALEAQLQKADSEIPDGMPLADPPKALHAHYCAAQNGSETAPGGVELQSVPLEEMLRQKPNAELMRIVQEFKRDDAYFLDRRAKYIAQGFRVEPSAFDAHHDRLAEIYAGSLEKCRALSALRSYAWTIGVLLENPLDVHNPWNYRSNSSVGVLEADAKLIAEFTARRKWLNYEDSGLFQALCGHPDLEVLYAPDELCGEEGKQLLKQWGLEVPVVSLSDLRTCLELLKPHMDDMLSPTFSEPRKPRTEACAEVIYAWCALCIAAKEPFFSRRGPATCSWTYPEALPEQKFDSELSLRKWKKDYTGFFETNPQIAIPGKRFVFVDIVAERNVAENAIQTRFHPSVEALIAQGGLYREKLSRMTDYLVIGAPDNEKSMRSSELDEAISLQKRGNPIQIVWLKDLEAALNREQRFN